MDQQVLDDIGVTTRRRNQQKHSGVRRVGPLIRGAAYRGIGLVDRIARWRDDAILPPAHLRIYYYRTWDRKRFARACAAARTELMLQGLQPEHRVLDVGSGIGNLALGLVGYLRGGAILSSGFIAPTSSVALTIRAEACRPGAIAFPFTITASTSSCCHHASHTHCPTRSSTTWRRSRASSSRAACALPATSC